MKCLCPCPDYINIPNRSWPDTILFFKEHEIVLHGKKATCQCELCGQALCDDCRVLSDYGLDDWEFAWPAATALCPDCAKEEELCGIQ